MAIREAGMAVTESGTSVTGGGHPPIRTRRFRYWTSRMTTGNPDQGLPIAGLVLKPGDRRAVFIAVPVQTPRCYIPRAWQVLDEFYVKERFGSFTKVVY